MSTSSAAKPRRADARRNYEALLEAGKLVFGRAGTDAPMEDVAQAAGVGQGTLYRHFPSRDHLFVAIMREQVDLLEAQARDLLEQPDAWDALTEWLRLYQHSALRYRGMSARVGSGLVEDGSPIAAACAPMKAGFADLFARALNEGHVHDGITALQLLTLVASLPEHSGAASSSEVYLDIVLRGIRTPGT